jgi:hypothetical protein
MPSLTRLVAIGALLTALMGCGGGSVPAEPVLLADGRTRGSVDFALDGARLASSLLVVDRVFVATECAVVEGIIGGPGVRRLLIFDTRISNLGELDLHIGDPANPLPPLDPADFEFHACHGHRHLHGYADYELRAQDGTVVVPGRKQGFCILDSERVLPHVPERKYTCIDQGLSSGWSDLYARTLDGQWVDVTGVPEGDYRLVVTINAEGNLPEAVDWYANTAEVPVHVPSPSSSVPSPDDHGDIPAAATSVAFPIGLVAALSPATDVDWFRLEVVVGNTYTIRTELLTLTDSALRLTSVSGSSTFDTNDDVVPGTDLSSRIVWTATFSGPVGIEVTGRNLATGTYRLVLE